MGSLRRLRSTNLPHPATLSYLLHRLSGLVLVLFIPFHLLLAGQVLVETATLSSVAGWRADPSFEFSVALLAAVLTMHIVGGLRIIAIEWFGKSGGPWGWLQAMLVLPALVAGLFVLI